LHGFVHLFLHRDDERHREGSGLAAAHTEGGLNSHFGRLVAQRPAERFGRRARSDLGQRQRDRFANAFVLVLELLCQRGHRFLERQLAGELRHVAHDEPLVVPQHVHQLIGSFLHSCQRHENPPTLLNGRRGHEQIEQDFDAILPRPAQHQQRVIAVRRMVGHLGDGLEQRFVVHPLERDRILPPSRRIAHLLLRPNDPRDNHQHLRRAFRLHRRLELAAEDGEQLADVGTVGFVLQLCDQIRRGTSRGGCRRESTAQGCRFTNDLRNILNPACCLRGLWRGHVRRRRGADRRDWRPEDKRLHPDGDVCRPTGTQARRDLFVPWLLGEYAQQLEHLGDRWIGRNRDFFHGVKFEPLQQRGAIDRPAIHPQASILNGDCHGFDLQQTRERPELRLLLALRPRIAEQVQGALK